MKYSKKQLEVIGEAVAEKFFPNLVREIALCGKGLSWRTRMLREYKQLERRVHGREEKRP